MVYNKVILLNPVRLGVCDYSKSLNLMLLCILVKPIHRKYFSEKSMYYALSISFTFTFHGVFGVSSRKKMALLNTTHVYQRKIPWKKNSLSKKFNLFFRFSILPFAIRYKCNRVAIYTHVWREKYQLQNYHSYWLYYYWRIDCSAFNLFCTIQCHPLPKFLFWICIVRNNTFFK